MAKTQKTENEERIEAERRENKKYDIGTIVIVKNEKECGVVTQYHTLHEKETYEYIVNDVHGDWSCWRDHNELKKIGVVA